MWRHGDQLNKGALIHLLEENHLEPYIRHIRFPQYKNVAPFTKIDFTFPITALVGANGTNKSSILRALYGTPGNNNLGNFWFSTTTDPIEGSAKYPNCFVYGYLNEYTNETVEVLKTRVKKESDPDYWEPSRPLKRYEMTPMPEFDEKDPNRLQTRWKNVEKNVELFDFRHALSAFDRYFYYGDLTQEETFITKKSFIRGRSKHLALALDSGRKSYQYYHERILAGGNGPLSDAERNFVGDILGRSYSKIELVHHSFYRLGGYTARICQSEHKYTEAFAGSGEFAVIMLVTTAMRAPKHSLILLDEPEVSLHPGAQERLIEFLAEMVLKHRHQVVFTTHSPALIRRLPPDAIKLLTVDGSTGKVILVSQEALAEEAFLEIGEPLPTKKTVVFEDRLAAEVAKHALRMHFPDGLKIVEFRYFPGGASALLSTFMPTFVTEKRNNVLCIFDGDQQRPASPWPNDEAVRVAQNGQLGAIIRECCGVDIQFVIDSGSDESKNEQRAQAQRLYLNWCFRNVSYLPGNGSPEQLILQACDEPVKGGKEKQKFVALAREKFGFLEHENPSASDIFAIQRTYLAKISHDNSDLAALAKRIREFVEAV